MVSVLDLSATACIFQGCNCRGFSVDILKVGVVSSWVGLLATFVIGGMQIGSAQEKIENLESVTEKHDRLFDEQRLEQRETRDRTIRIEEQTKAIEAGQRRIENLIKSLR